MIVWIGSVYECDDDDDDEEVIDLWRGEVLRCQWQGWKGGMDGGIRVEGMEGWRDKGGWKRGRDGGIWVEGRLDGGIWVEGREGWRDKGGWNGGIKFEIKEQWVTEAREE
ncbi:hypothetical protein Pmani_002623 [Petrolisthes manimaculis]|uniref:Uncharacterized protein n=1 Tax=Petrolisthes manimaculis TaxID=1843537 RepID=A0AAE1QKK6_9EUCA|nr:hypothetical protein Pmani_002623 [Petrolisthes manimaculis]